MNESNELAIVTSQNAVEIFTGGGLNAILDGVEKKVRAMSLDASTATGREEIRSVAYKVTRTKTALDAEAKKLTEGWRTATSQVNAERKRSQERLESLAEEVRAPLTAFENKEKNRVAAHEAALADIETSSNITLWAGRDWEEFGDRYRRVCRVVAEANRARLKAEEDQAELARLRKEETERKVREHEARLKAEAAESARIEAELSAKQAANAEARRVIEAARKEEDRVKAEAERVRAEHERVQRKAEAARQREQDAREAAERKAIADLKAAHEKSKKDAALAVAKERDRVEAQRKAEAEVQAKREADQKLRDKIRNEIREDLNRYVEGSVFKAPLNAEEVLEALMDGKVRHVRVVF